MRLSLRCLYRMCALWNVFSIDCVFYRMLAVCVCVCTYVRAHVCVCARVSVYISLFAFVLACLSFGVKGVRV